MILIVDMNWKKASLGCFEFVLPITEAIIGLEDFFVKHFLEVTDQDISESSKIILSGTALKDTTIFDQLEKFKWIMLTEKPILGICAGMLTIGCVFGSKLIKCSEIGITKITTLVNNPLFSSSFKAYSLHQYSLEVSSDFEVLAKSTKCVQAIRHKKKAIFGVLFHPEVRNEEILKRFVKENA
jgi:GMP synthase-like glutamine amidotransferase